MDSSPLVRPRHLSISVRCESKNGHQKDMCLKEIGLHAQNMLNNFRVNSQHDSGVPI